ncbi:hypothetical protein F4780DRAFT_727713 [Xylariomycetidae sp. FL0641]|nr:hypothetical protein F4780DRAFT_727713 [Xylariomycetidae sp. FL0641]
MDKVQEIASKFANQPDDDDLKEAPGHASRHAGEAGDESLFTTLVGALAQKKASIPQDDVDEDEAVKHHKQYYGDGDDNDADDKSMGAAAAMQALKMFAGGETGSSAENNSQSAFIGMAMGEASKLFDQKSSEGKVSSTADKQQAIMQAGEMALKFYMKSKGDSGGGSSGLMGMASKFLQK